MSDESIRQQQFEALVARADALARDIVILSSDEKTLATRQQLLKQALKAGTIANRLDWLKPDTGLF